jgi:putative membrane protein
MFLGVVIFLIGLLLVLDCKKQRIFNSCFCQRSDRAMDILRERYARGEITADEFKTMKDTLDNDFPQNAFQKN